MSPFINIGYMLMVQKKANPNLKGNNFVNSVHLSIYLSNHNEYYVTMDSNGIGFQKKSIMENAFEHSRDIIFPFEGVFCLFFFTEK